MCLILPAPVRERACSTTSLCMFGKGEAARSEQLARAKASGNAAARDAALEFMLGTMPGPEPGPPTAPYVYVRFGR